MRLYLINPFNSLVNLTNVAKSWWNRYRVWKPLGLLVLAGLTPDDWEITIIDENVRQADYAAMPKPDLVGITAFTSQANRAYELADEFRSRGVKVVIGGIHATMCQDEAAEHVDSIVTGEAEDVWADVLRDVAAGSLQPIYAGGNANIADAPAARHDLLTGDYTFGAIQTTRGCPLNCEFCSVSAFNGKAYRQRPIENVIEEFKLISEKRVLIVDDNLIGTTSAHIARAKDLFRAMIDARLQKHWMAQVTINMADDDELLSLAAKAGCNGVFIGFETATAEGLAEIGKKFNGLKGRDPAEAVRRIQKHGIIVVGSFIMGLDVDERGIGSRIADTASTYGVDILNTLFLTPLPGTRLWAKMAAANRIAANNFPHDWRYYTLGYPTARYKHFSARQIADEMNDCDNRFYSRRNIVRRLIDSFIKRRHPLWGIVSNLSYRSNMAMAHARFAELIDQDVTTGLGSEQGHFAPVSQPSDLPFPRSSRPAGYLTTSK